MTDTWLTPPDLLQQLGPFDLDPCTPPEMPWTTAARRYTPIEDGLQQPWFGLVWLNPPWSDVYPWIRKLAAHGSGLALVPVSTGCRYWQEFVFPYAYAVLFISRRIKFMDGEGKGGRWESGHYTALVAFGAAAAERLSAAYNAGSIKGWLIARSIEQKSFSIVELDLA